MTNLNESKAVRLARFLREHVQSRTSVVRDLDAYESVLWFRDVPLGKGIISAAHRADVDDEEVQEATWLEVRDEDVPPPPEPSEDLVPWMDPISADHPSEQPPRLKTLAMLPDGASDSDEDSPSLVSCRLEDHPGVRAAYERYAMRWNEWAELQRDAIRAKALYRTLFSIHTQLLRDGEQVELCLGLGLLDWPAPGKKATRVRRHAVTVGAQLHFSAREGVIRVECPDDGVRLSLEDDMLDPELQPGRRVYEEVKAQLDDIQRDDAVWDRGRVHTALETWSRGLAADSKWSPSLEPVPGDGDQPRVSWAPALILRKRGHAAMLRMYDRIIDQLISLDDDQLPPGWRSLIDDYDDHVGPSLGRGGEDSGPRSAACADECEHEIFFPLPANKQQREIVEAIRTRRGVLVQGPPGTGKSHTIANLMCDLLAAGQRVLVTAENPRALAVLRDKLPEDIRSLCISVLGSGGESFKELNATVQQISARRAQWSEAESTDLVVRLRRDLVRLRGEKDEVERELRDLRLGETATHAPAPGYSGSPQAIAQRVAAARDRHGWLILGKNDSDACPVSSGDAVRWLELTRSHVPEAAVASRLQLPEPKDLPTPREFSELLGSVSACSERLEAYPSECGHPSFAALVSRSADELARLKSEVGAMRERWRNAPATPWCRQAASEVAATRGSPWRVLLNRSQELLEDARSLTEEIGARQVRLPAGRPVEQVQSDAQAVLEHLRSGGKWRGLGGLIKPKPVKGREYLLTEAAVDGSAPDEEHELEVLILAAKLHSDLDAADALWAESDPQSSAVDDATRHMRLAARVGELEEVVQLAEHDIALRQRVQAMTRTDVDPSWLTGPGADWAKIIEAARIAAERQRLEGELAETLRRLDRVVLMHDCHPAVADARTAFGSRDVAAFGRALEQIASARATRSQDDERVRLDSALSERVPTLRAMIVELLEDARWRDRLEELDEAWAWAAADRWLRRFADPDGLTRCEAARKQLEDQIRDTLTRLAAELAWRKFFERLSTREVNALKSWRETVKMMGKGTGRSRKIERLRRMARQYMDQCRDAIPVWIMPRYLVAEMIEASAGRFDTVIVDEASQMGIGGLFVFYIGQRTIIVGDDQQISPSDVGVEDAGIESLQRKYIPDVAHAQALMRGGSVYQNATIRFGRSVTLREHFRCMPEIIQFSNDLCYAPNQTPLDPLRSYSGSRLEPLKAVYVQGGQRSGGHGSAKNDAEARMIVAEIERCLDDPQYEGKTFGVISLQGKAQAQLIERLLLDRVDPEVIEERHILCGDSSAFQGDERHVIFLSMVASRGETRLQTLSASTYVQRFNVAVSRAQDQLWLFHSLDLADLKPECLRYRLLHYVRSPHRAIVEGTEQRFDSPFERDVFDRIADRGYRVQSQVAVGDARSHSYRIDLVVEGLSGKLAVECDGDRWHGPDRYEADMARQRDLERVGWEFVRIPGSGFYRDPDRALGPLWDRLEERGIYPADRVVNDDGEAIPEEGDSLEQASVNGGSDDHLFRSEATSAAGDEPAEAIGGEAGSADPEPAPRLRVVDQEDGPYAPDPRTASSADVRAALVELVRRHGPLPREAAIRRYVRAVGLGRTGRVLRQSLSKALRDATRRGELLLAEELPRHISGEVVRVHGSPAVVVRPRGDREFEEIPPSEWAQRMRGVAAGPLRLGWQDRDALYRAVLVQLEFKSLTKGRREMLDAAWAMARVAEEAAG